MLEVRKLYTGYGGMDVIHGIDISVGAGEIVALVGANGAGKSTLVKTISGLLPVRAGEIMFEGERIDRLSPTARVLKGIAQVPEGRQVFGGLTVAENLRLGAYVHRHALAGAELERRMREVCERFPILLERRDEQVANLSGGQQQMLVIARGLMAKPRLLILDEPSLGLAPVLVVEIFRLIAELRAQGGVSIVLSEQNAKLSLAIADRAYVIETGRVALAGTGKELLASPEVAERYLGVGHAVSVADAARHAQLVGQLKEIFSGNDAGTQRPSS
ncbi:MAG TPA: ABC transporter ATP-binding protein [Stellaceae bacterium]|nr:ABC transporter ATP-binding protein [Stellaceae bacterium]